MTMEKVSDIGYGGAGLNDRLPKVLAELQGLTTTVVNGAAAATNIAVAGIAVEDTIQSAIAYSGGVPAPVVATVFAAGQIRITTDTTGMKVVLNWYNKH